MIVAAVAVVVLFLAGKLHPFVQLDRTRNETAADRKKKQLVATFYSFAIFFQLYRALQKYFAAKIFKSAASARQKKKSIEIRIAVVVVVVVTVVEIVWTFETVWRSRKKIDLSSASDKFLEKFCENKKKLCWFGFFVFEAPKSQN